MAATSTINLDADINQSDIDLYQKLNIDPISQNDGELDIIQQDNQEIYCPICKRDSLLIQNGITICGECGTEASCNIDTKAEWNWYKDSKVNNNRCGPANNELLYESSFSTRIATNGKNKYIYRVINKLQSWQMMSAQERSLKQVFDTIYQQASLKGIPQTIIEHAQVLFKKVTQEQSKYGKTKLCRGGKREGLIAACLYYSCNLNKVNRTKKEIANIFEINESDVTRGCKIFFKLMNKKVCLTDNIMTYHDFIDRYCSNLGLNHTVRATVKKIADKAHELGIVQNNTPPTIVAASIFLVSTIYSLNLSKNLISQQCGTSQVTITKTYNKLINNIEHLI